MTTEPTKTFELGVYTFGNTPHTADGGYGPTAQAIRDALEAVRLAEEVGLDVFGFGEHHTRSMPVSSPTSLVVTPAPATPRGSPCRRCPSCSPPPCSPSASRPCNGGRSRWPRTRPHQRPDRCEQGEV
jgi:hypothetical protein